jgi:hypothetical protein
VNRARISASEKPGGPRAPDDQETPDRADVITPPAPASGRDGEQSYALVIADGGGSEADLAGNGRYRKLRHRARPRRSAAAVPRGAPPAAPA